MGFDDLTYLQTHDFVLSLRISSASIVILLFLFASAQQIVLPRYEEAIAQQQFELETTQKIQDGSNFMNYTNPQYGFSLLYPSSWVNEEIPPGANLTYLISFNPPPTEFREFVYVYMAVKNLTSQNTSLGQFADQEINFLEKRPAATSPIEDMGVRTILESELTTIAGNTPAHKVVYSEKVSGTLSKITEIYAINGDKGYILSYVADTAIYEKYLPIVQKMIGSLNVSVS